MTYTYSMFNILNIAGNWIIIIHNKEPKPINIRNL